MIKISSKYFVFNFNKVLEGRISPFHWISLYSVAFKTNWHHGKIVAKSERVPLGGWGCLAAWGARFGGCTIQTMIKTYFFLLRSALGFISNWSSDGPCLPNGSSGTMNWSPANVNISNLQQRRLHCMMRFRGWISTWEIGIKCHIDLSCTEYSLFFLVDRRAIRVKGTRL